MAKTIKRKPRIKKLTLDKSTVLHVKVPKGVVPIVAAHPDKIEIVPAVSRKDAEVGWWDFLFGTEKF
jgi:hypothetical protein